MSAISCVEFGTHVVEHDEGLRPSTTVVTDGVEDTMPPESREELLNEEDQQDGTDGGQEEIVNHEQSVELESGEVFHDFTTTEDYDVVCHHEGRGLLKGRHGSHTLDKLELAGWVAHDILERLIEDGPQMNAKWPVNCREGHILKKFGRHDD